MPAAARRAPKKTPHLAIPIRSSAEEIWAVNEALHPHLVAALHGEVGQGALQACRARRRLPIPVLKTVGLGYIAPGDRTLVSLGVQLGLDLEVMADAALISRNSFAIRDAYAKTNPDTPDPSPRDLSAFFLAHCVGRAEFYRDYYGFYSKDKPGGKQEYLAGHWYAIPVRVKDAAGRVRIGGYQLRTAHTPERADVKKDRWRHPRETPALNWKDVLVGAAEARGASTACLVEGAFDRYALEAAVVELPEAERPDVFELTGASTRGAAGDDDGATRVGVLRQIQADRVVMCLDADTTGLWAALTHATTLLALGKHVLIAQVEDGRDASMAADAEIKDFSDLYREGGAAAVQRALRVAERRGVLTYATGLVESELAYWPRRGQMRHRLAALDRLAPIVAAFPERTRPRAIERAVAATGLPAAVVEAAITAEHARDATARRVRAERRERRTPAMRGPAVAPASCTSPARPPAR